MGLQIFDEKLAYARCGSLPIDGGSATVTIATANNGPLRVDAIFLGNTDAAPAVVQVLYRDSAGNPAPVAVVSVPAHAGETVDLVEVISSALPASVPGLTLGINQYIQLFTLGTGGAGAVVTFATMGGLT